jgi:CubicO group peptidase (beta-lactamase class C family)
MAGLAYFDGIVLANKKISAYLRAQGIPKIANSTLDRPLACMPPGQPAGGYGFFSTDVSGTRAIGNNGGGPGINSTFTVYPELGYTIVVMSNYDPPSATKVTSKVREMLTAK